jgi:hypothetical protein
MQPPLVFASIKDGAIWCSPSPSANTKGGGDLVFAIAFGEHQRWLAIPSTKGGWWWRSRPP